MSSDYVIDRPGGKNFCVDTLLYGPICMCNKYHGGEFGFCIPDLAETAGYTLIQKEVTALVKSSKFKKQIFEQPLRNTLLPCI
jgi:hypothetical protein